MYRIKQAAARAGVSVELLRAWERRYGVVHPDRTASGYRVYDDVAIDRLRAMRHLVDDGWSPSAAATSILESDDDRVRELALADVPGRGAVAASPAGGGFQADATTAPADDLVDRFVVSATALDASAVEADLDAIFARGSFESVMDGLMFPALQLLGAAWAAGRIDVAAEHAATHAVLRRLGSAFQAAGRPNEEAPILVGLPAGSRHEIGALAFAIAARRAGLPVLYLGADLPASDWVEAAATRRAAAAVVGVVTRADRPAADHVVDVLHHARPGILIALGGAGAEIVDPADPGTDGTGAIHLPPRLGDAVEAVRAGLERGRRAAT